MVKILAVILLVLMLVIGRDRGLQSFLTILMNIAILAGVLFAIALGFSPLIVGTAAGLLLTVLILFYQNGYHLKTKVAFGVIVAVQVVMLLIGMVLCVWGHAGGYSEVKINLDDGLFLDGNVNLSMMQVEITVILLSLLGAVKDAAVAVTSAVYEVHRNNPDLEQIQLFASGLKIGREILATSINTLFFSCVGESLLLFHIICYWGYSFGYILNSKALYQVFLYSGIAGLGCIAAIPLSAMAMATVLKRKGRV
ncbi:MAG: YibE/F family protein [Eubacteriales bacterium]|nr:YibE/F family protein [Eubacteriales bacterium]